MANDVPERSWHGIEDNPYNPHAWVIGDPQIGPGTWIGAFTVIDGSGGLTIGEGCNISAGAQLYTHSTVARCLSEGKRAIERSATSLGAFVHVGANAVVLMGSVNGDHCVIAAGALVRENTVAPPHSVLRGVPAEVFPGAALKYSEP